MFYTKPAVNNNYLVAYIKELNLNSKNKVKRLTNIMNTWQDLDKELLLLNNLRSKNILQSKGFLMTHLTMIRHGQANSVAKDEHSYDILTSLGHQQAKWFGEHLLKTETSFDKIYSGTLRRQIETAQGVNQLDLPHIKDERLNELDYFGLANSLQDLHAIPLPETQKEFAKQINTILRYWKLGKISSPIENFKTFHARIVQIVKELVQSEEKILAVSSAGVIASLFGELLEIPLEQRVKLFLAIAHTSVHRFETLSGFLAPTLFGATPHLANPERQHARTFV